MPTDDFHPTVSLYTFLKALISIEDVEVGMHQFYIRKALVPHLY